MKKRTLLEDNNLGVVYMWFRGSDWLELRLPFMRVLVHHGASFTPGDELLLTVIFRQSVLQSKIQILKKINGNCHIEIPLT